MEGALEEVSGWTEKSDDDLMRAFQAGDVDGFEALVRRYRGRLAAFVAQRLGDRELAEDFVQETFLRVYQQAADYIPMGRFRGWLYAIARNLCFTSLADARRHLGLTPDAPMILWTWESEAIAAEKTEREIDEERRRALAEATQSLPEKQRRVIWLRYYHGLTVAEIAEVEECPVGTVKSRLYHGHRRLREKLGRMPCLAQGAE